MNGMQDNLFPEDENELVFMDDYLSDEQEGETWKILLVDDEDEVHTVTRLALDNFNFAGKGVTFLSAYSGQQAQDLIKANPNIGLVLLDVIMETDDAGLLVVKFIRETLKNHLVRIVLRTGQPGQAPEEKEASGQEREKPEDWRLEIGD